MERKAMNYEELDKARDEAEKRITKLLETIRQNQQEVSQIRSIFCSSFGASPRSRDGSIGSAILMHLGLQPGTEWTVNKLQDACGVARASLVAQLHRLKVAGKIEKTAN